MRIENKSMFFSPHIDELTFKMDITLKTIFSFFLFKGFDMFKPVRFVHNPASY